MRRRRHPARDRLCVGLCRDRQARTRRAAAAARIAGARARHPADRPELHRHRQLPDRRRHHLLRHAAPAERRPARDRRGQPVRRAGLRAGAGDRTRGRHQPRPHLRQRQRRGCRRSGGLSRRGSRLPRDRLPVRGHRRAAPADRGRRACLGGRQAARHLQARDRRGRCACGDVAHRLACRHRRSVERRLRPRRRGRGQGFRRAARDRPLPRQGIAAEGAGRRGGGDLGRRRHHGGRYGGAARRRAAAARRRDPRRPGVAHPGIRLAAQSVRRHRPGHHRSRRLSRLLPGGAGRSRLWRAGDAARLCLCADGRAPAGDERARGAVGQDRVPGLAERMDRRTRGAGERGRPAHRPVPLDRRLLRRARRLACPCGSPVGPRRRAASLSTRGRRRSRPGDPRRAGPGADRARGEGGARALRHPGDRRAPGHGDRGRGRRRRLARLPGGNEDREPGHPAQDRGRRDPPRRSTVPMRSAAPSPSWSRRPTRSSRRRGSMACSCSRWRDKASS